MQKKIKKAKKKLKTKPVERDDQLDMEFNDDVPSVPKKGRTAAIDYAEFVATWRDAGSVSEVAEAMGIKRNSASAIAARLRKGGVVLKSFPRRGSQPIDVKRLNKIAAGKAD